MILSSPLLKSRFSCLSHAIGSMELLSKLRLLSGIATIPMSLELLSFSVLLVVQTIAMEGMPGLSLGELLMLMLLLVLPAVLSVAVG